MTLLNRNRCSDRRYCRGLCFGARSALGRKNEVSQLFRLHSTDTSQDSLAEQILKIRTMRRKHSLSWWKRPTENGKTVWSLVRRWRC